MLARSEYLHSVSARFLAKFSPCYIEFNEYVLWCISTKVFGTLRACCFKLAHKMLLRMVVIVMILSVVPIIFSCWFSGLPKEGYD